MTPFENEVSGSQTENEVETPETPETTEVSETPEASGSEEVSEEPETPAYTPNYKFKFAVAGKPTAEEKEFDEVLKPLIKDAETEKKFRDLYEKAYGLDFVKPRYQQTREQLQQVKEEFTGLTTELQHVGKAIERGDYGVLLENFGIPEEKLLRWAAKRVQYLTEMSQEERQRVDQETERERRLRLGDDEMAKLREENLEHAMTLRHIQLDTAIGRQDVSSIAQAVDAKLGQGAFKTEIIALAAQLSDQYGKDIPVETAVKAAVRKWAPFAAAQSPAPQKEEDPQGRSKGQPPVIPHLRGRGTSPAKKVIGSIDELKKLGNSATYQADEE